MKKPKRIGAIATVTLLLAACTTLQSQTGFIPSDEDLDSIVVGRDTRENVRSIIGVPTGRGVLDQSGWFYVRSSFERNNFRAPVEVDRQVVSISFDENNLVTNVERFGLEDGQVIALSRRVTDDNTQGIGFLQQLFGNFGRIDPTAILGGN